MQNKNSDSLMKAHFILLLLLCAGTGISLVFMLIKGMSLPLCVALMQVVIFLSQLCGLIYVRKGYQKGAAVYFKAFIMLTAIADVILVITTSSSRGFHIDSVMICVRIVILLLIAFGKDLGKRNTWILFYIVLAIDLLYGILFVPHKYLVLLIIVGVIGKLVIDGTIGLAIRGKYADKEARYVASQEN